MSLLAVLDFDRVQHLLVWAHDGETAWVLDLSEINDVPRVCRFLTLQSGAVICHTSAVPSGTKKEKRKNKSLFIVLHLNTIILLPAVCHVHRMAAECPVAVEVVPDDLHAV